MKTSATIFFLAILFKSKLFEKKCLPYLSETFSGGTADSIPFHDYIYDAGFF